MIQTSKQPSWTDEAGTQIPFSRTTNLERLKERNSATIIKRAVILNRELKEFKDQIRNLSAEVFDMAMKSNHTQNATKGNFTWYNFDRSLKIEVSISDRITFDDLNIKSAKQLFDDFLNDSIDPKVDFIRELISDAFTTSHNNLDPKKIMSLLKYRSKITDVRYQNAIRLIEQGIRKPDSKTYFRIWQKNEEGKYENIDLNLSSI